MDGEIEDRKQTASARKYVPGTFNDGKLSSKRLMATPKKPVSTGIREITKKPVLYNKTGFETGKPVKKIQQKPAVKNVVQTAPKAIESTTKVSPASKPEVKKSPEAPAEPFLVGHYELSPLLSKMLEAELQDIMIKIWQLQPDDPKDEAEKVVVERFRNNAGDYLMNTLGLNVTKRLLNVHNSLYVKMQFSGKPLRADLVNFVRKYNLCSFKSVGIGGGTFAAKMKNFQDFDNLCTAKNLKCGRIRVTVTPCYQFTKCPSNLRTCYDGKQVTNVAKYKQICALRRTESQDNAKTEKDGNVQKDASKQNTTVKVTPSKANGTSKVEEKISPPKTNVAAKDVKKSEVTTIKPAALENKTPAVKPITKPNQAVTQNSAPKAAPNQTKSQNPALKEAANPIQSQNSTSTVTANLTKSQNSAPKLTANATQPQNPTPKTTAKQTATSSQSSATKAVPSQNENTPAKITPAKPAGTNNQNTSTEAKTKPTNQNAVQKVTQEKAVTKLNSPKVQTKQAVKATPNKAMGHKVPPKPKSKQISPVKKPENDFDELDDHDILALISGGIVLDECSGSEDD